MTINSKPGGFTVKEFIEALQQIPVEAENHVVKMKPGEKVTQIDVWDDGVELS